GEVALHFAVLPLVARNGRANDNRGALRLGLGHKLAQIPAVAVHHFLLLGEVVEYLFAFVGVAADSAPRPRR
nr:hypothetical protein [Tanacetum cinerariifolium]